MAVQNPEADLNIKDLILEEPEKHYEKRIFVPEKYFIAQEWHELMERIYPVGGKEWLVRPTSLAILSPQRSYQLNLQELCQPVLEEKFKGEGLVSGFTSLQIPSDILAARVLCPNWLDNFDKHDLGDFNDWWADFRRTIDNGFLSDAFYTAVGIKSLYPDQSRDLELPVKVINFMVRERTSFMTTGENAYAIQIAAFAKILNPNLKELIEFNPDEWVKIREGLNSAKDLAYKTFLNDDWNDFSWFASDLTILSADHIEVGADGLVLLQNPPQQKTENPIPEGRKF